MLSKEERERLHALLATMTPGELVAAGDKIRVKESNWPVAQVGFNVGDAEVFAAAVNSLPAILDALDAADREREEAVRAERDACALVANDWGVRYGQSPVHGQSQWCAPACAKVRDAIRARSKP